MICHKYLSFLSPKLVNAKDPEDEAVNYFAQHVFNVHFEQAKKKLSEFIGCPFHK